jgi:SAM-dependent methyltransferase
MAQQLETYSELLKIVLDRVQSDPRGVVARKVRFLDFGCGVGAGILALCRQGFPYETFATDFSVGTLAYLSSQGVRAAEGLDGMPDATEIDAVVLSDVLEHVSNPAFLIEQIASRTANRGVIWISVPNFIDWRMRAAIKQVKSGGSVVKDLNPWEHLSYFSPSSLDVLMAKQGFRRVRFDQLNLTIKLGSKRDLLISSVRLLRDFVRAYSGKHPYEYTTTAAFVRD